MPYLAGLAHMAMAAFFAVHAIRTGRDRYWLFILFMFPLLGSIVYFFAEYLGDMRNTRGGQRAWRMLQGVVNPDGELRAALAEFDRTPTAANEARLARAWLAKGDTAKAIEHYRRCTSGPYATDASFLKGLAIAQLEGGHAADAVATLEALFAAHPGQRTGDAALMHAEALAGAGRPEARAAFEAVMAADGSLEARCKYGKFLQSQGDRTGARQAFEAVLADARRGHHHSRDMNREWIDAANAGLKEGAG
jgi:hypothetical protein